MLNRNLVGWGQRNESRFGLNLMPYISLSGYVRNVTFFKIADFLKL